MKYIILQEYEINKAVINQNILLLLNPHINPILPKKPKPKPNKLRPKPTLMDWNCTYFPTTSRKKGAKQQ
jgi:hypothetical protein